MKIVLRTNKKIVKGEKLTHDNKNTIIRRHHSTIKNLTSGDNKNIIRQKIKTLLSKKTDNEQKKYLKKALEETLENHPKIIHRTFIDENKVGLHITNITHVSTEIDGLNKQKISTSLIGIDSNDENQYVPHQLVYVELKKSDFNSNLFKKSNTVTNEKEITNNVITKLNSLDNILVFNLQTDEFTTISKPNFNGFVEDNDFYNNVTNNTNNNVNNNINNID